MMSVCPYCGAEVLLKDATFIYNSKESKEWGKVYVCSNYPSCNAYVGCHKDTDIPLGRLANERLRTLKMEAHKQFDPLWKSKFMQRREAYKWLSKELNIPISECHIGMFDIKMCQRVIHICRKFKNPIVEEYRDKVYSKRTHPMFSRGYNRNVSK